MTSGTATPHAAQMAARICQTAAANLRAAQKPAPMKTRPRPMPMRSVKAFPAATGMPSKPMIALPTNRSRWWLAE